MVDQTRYKLCYFVPPTSLQATKDAIFGTNLAGIFSSLTDVNKTLYTDVCWETSGTGRFIPGPDSTPDIGTPGQLEVLEEVRVEVQVRGKENVKHVVDALKQAHPYEVPVYEVYRMEEF
ncbi:hypothetical protein M436DRAFT_67231 [Aureobasidium namibiae CBS 147.97]|uniref:ATP phosphoribosyltransferase n=1 Tax=Aureobasidium namibiae CBS 147.97 TaxID=1043004 RepID=A0A074W922_9PEZI